MGNGFASSPQELVGHVRQGTCTLLGALRRRRRQHSQIEVVEHADDTALLCPIVHQVIGTDVAVMQPPLP